MNLVYTKDYCPISLVGIQCNTIIKLLAIQMTKYIGLVMSSENLFTLKVDKF